MGYGEMFLVLVAGFLVLYLGVSVFLVYFRAHPRRICCNITPDQYDLVYEEVTFAGCDAVELSGWYIPSRNGAAIILTHGHGGNRGQVLDRAVILARRGYGVLLYDMCHHGESGGKYAVGDRCCPNDVQSAFSYLRGREDVDPQRIGALGFSAGADATIVAAARTDGIRCIVLDGAYPGPVWNVVPPLTALELALLPMFWVNTVVMGWYTGVSQAPSFVQLIGEIAPRPISFIATGLGGEQRNGRRMYAAAGEPKTLWEIPEAAHGEGISRRPQEYAERLVAFFDHALSE